MCEENVGGRLGRKLGNMGYDFVNDAFQASALGHSFKKAREWFGQGDYTIKANSIIDTGGDPRNLKMITNGNPWTDFIFREYLGDITAPATPAAFNSTTYAINPGLVQLHPWLAPIAQQFEQYEPMGIVFEFKSLLSDYSSTQVLGSVMMATDYDPSDPPYATKLEFMNAQYSSQAKPTETLLHGVECDPSQRPQQLMYVRAGNLPSTEDIKDYDLGNFQIATQGLGVSAGTPIGSLFVHYHYRFYKQQLNNGLLQKGTLTSLFGVLCSGGNLGTFSEKWNTLGLTPSATLPDLLRLTFPSYITSGTYLIVIGLTSASGAAGQIIELGATSNCAQATNVDGENFFKTDATPDVSKYDLLATINATETGCAIVAITVTGANAYVEHAISLEGAAQLVIYVVNVNNFDSI